MRSHSILRSGGPPLRGRGRAALCALGLVSATVLNTEVAHAQQNIPTSDTEDAELGSLPVRPGRWHLFATVDVRNGDYARGSYDDDASGLHQVPIHAQLGLAINLHQKIDGSADAVLLVETNNGFHGPRVAETSTPRAWYESNNLLGIALRPLKDVTMAFSYTNKSSPNGVSGTTHEISGAFAYEGASALGQLHPTATITLRPAAGRGAYAQVGAEPSLKLSKSSSSGEISIPLHVGVGWGGFYETGTGTVTYGNIGLAFSQPFSPAGKRVRFRAEVLALIRDPTLRRLDGDQADHAAVVPLATISLATTF